jgi:8-amino-7-oxononanoate synthase
MQHVARFRREAGTLGLQMLESATPIQPVVLGSEAAAVAASDVLRARGLWVPAIRPPTVPAGSSRLRITFSAAHEASDVDRLLEALEGLPATMAEASSA